MWIRAAAAVPACRPDPALQLGCRVSRCSRWDRTRSISQTLDSWDREKTKRLDRGGTRPSAGGRRDAAGMAPSIV